MALPFQTKRAVALEELNNLRVHAPARLINALKVAMGAKFDDFVAWLIQEAKDRYAAQRDDTQESIDAIDLLPDEEPAEEPEP